MRTYICVLFGLIALAGAMSICATGTVGCGGSSPTITNPGLTVVEVVDQFNRTVYGTVDLTRLQVGWKVHIRPNTCCVEGAEIKASAYDAKATMTHGSLPTNPTVGDEAYAEGVRYVYCGARFGWVKAVPLPGASSITPDGAGGVWVTFATVDKKMAVVVVETYNDKPMGMPIVIGVDPDAKPTVSFPPITSIVIGQPYILIVQGGVSWVIPEQGIALNTIYNDSYMVGVLTMNSQYNLVVTFNQYLQLIMNQIPAGQTQDLTITYAIGGQSYSFVITVTGTGSGGGGDTPSVITLNLPSTVSGTIPITVTALDNQGILSVVVLCDGAVIGSGSTSPLQFEWDTSTVGDGDHVIKVQVTDGEGHTTTSSPVTVNVNNTGGATVIVEGIRYTSAM